MAASSQKKAPPFFDFVVAKLQSLKEGSDKRRCLWSRLTVDKREAEGRRSELNGPADTEAQAGLVRYTYMFSLVSLGTVACVDLKQTRLKPSVAPKISSPVVVSVRARELEVMECGNNVVDRARGGSRWRRFKIRCSRRSVLRMPEAALISPPSNRSGISNDKRNMTYSTKCLTEG